MNPRVEDTIPLDDYRLLLSFSNGEKGIYDCSQLFHLEVFNELKRCFYFRQVKVIGGTVVWPDKQNISPNTLYMESEKIAVKS